MNILQIFSADNYFNFCRIHFNIIIKKKSDQDIVREILLVLHEGADQG